MPGLVGFIAQKDGSESILKNMQDIISYFDFYVKDKLFVDVNNSLYATRSHINVIQKESQPFEANNIYIWLDGEFYNQSDLLESSESVKTDAGILHNLYRKHKDFSFLKQIDGIYSAVIYDKINHKLHLCSDRYGLKHLYWSKKNGALVWASEVKTFSVIPWITPTVDLQSVKDFFSIGYLMENRTWFNEVELIPSGTVLSYDLHDSSIETFRYWWWDQIKPIENRIEESEITEELGRLFIASVRKRCRKDQRIGLSLSGGLDSRAVLAAIPEYTKQIQAVTFGMKGCDDIRIAEIVAKVKRCVEHHIFYIDEQNWIKPRVQGVWWTDGQLNLMHMHGIEGLEQRKGLINKNIDGFAGDLILGGSYMKNKSYFDTCNLMIAANHLKIKPEQLDFKHYFNLTKMDYFFLQNRVRRFTYNGPKIAESYMTTLKPFHDNQLIEFIYSLKDKIRFNNYIYSKMLLKTFPEFYTDIPWQKTGYPITAHYSKVLLMSTLRRAKNKLFLILDNNLSKFKYVKRLTYTDYPKWLRVGDVKLILNNILLNKNALYPDYISKDNLLYLWNAHMKGANHADVPCRYLTFELWLQQFYNNNYRKKIIDY